MSFRIKPGSRKHDLIEGLRPFVFDDDLLQLFADRLSKGHKVERSNDLLFHACEIGSVDLVKALLEGGCKPNSSHQEEFPLFSASREGHAEIVRLLLEAGARVNARGEDEATPLLEAAARGHLVTVKVLLEAGAKPNLKDSLGQSPLLVALYNQNAEVVELLKTVTSKQEVKIAERIKAAKEMVTPEGLELHDAVKKATLLKTQLQYLPRVEQLLAQGVSPDSRAEDGFTALMLSKTPLDIRLQDLFLHYGASVDIQDFYGTSVLDWTAHSGYDFVYARFYEFASPATRRKADKIKKLMIDTGRWETKVKLPTTLAPEILEPLRSLLIERGAVINE